MALPAYLILDDSPSGKSNTEDKGMDEKLKDILAMPEIQRARVAQFCYPRVHMREMGLKIAATCSLQALKLAFGAGAKVVFDQSRDIESTISSLEQRSRTRTPITLAVVNTDG